MRLLRQRQHERPRSPRKHVFSNRFSSAMADDDSVDSSDDDSMDSSDDNEEKYSGKYSEKSQLTALLLCILLGEFTGAGRFYAGDYAAGTIKLLLVLFLCFGCCCIFRFMITTAASAESGNIFAAQSQATCLWCCACAYALSIIGIFVWWIVDVALFAQNDITDEDGLTLTP